MNLIICLWIFLNLLGVNPDKRAIWKPMKIASFKDKNWTQINGGQHHTLALDNEGRYIICMSLDVLVFHQQKACFNLYFLFLWNF